MYIVYLYQEWKAVSAQDLYIEDEPNWNHRNDLWTDYLFCI